MEDNKIQYDTMKLESHLRDNLEKNGFKVIDEIQNVDYKHLGCIQSYDSIKLKDIINEFSNGFVRKIQSETDKREIYLKVESFESYTEKREVCCRRFGTFENIDLKVKAIYKYNFN